MYVCMHVAYVVAGVRRKTANAVPTVPWLCKEPCRHARWDSCYFDNPTNQQMHSGFAPISLSKL